MSRDEDRYRQRRQFVAEARAQDAKASPAAIRQSLANKHAAIDKARPDMRQAPPRGVAFPPMPSPAVPLASAVDAAELVLGDKLGHLTRGAQRKLGLQPAAGGRETAIAPVVPPTYRPLAGLQQNQRGQTIRVDSTLFNTAPTIDNPVGNFPETTVVQARSPGDDAEMVAIVLGYQLSAPIVFGEWSDVDMRVTAKLQWGIGAADFVAEVDWLNGTIIALPANYLRVIAKVPDNSGASPLVPGLIFPTFILSAGIAYGAPPQYENRARFTIELSSTTNSERVEIPDFADGYTIIPSSSGGGPYSIQQQDNSGSGVVGEHIYNVTSNAGSQGTNTFPILQGADFLQVTNLVPGGTVEGIFVVFNLVF